MNYTDYSVKLLAVTLTLLVMVKWVSVSGSNWGCREEERSALLQINAALPFPIIYSSDGKWEGMECCRWERVTCDRTTGHVTQLDLSHLSTDDWLKSPGRFLLNATIFLPLRQLRSLSLSGQGIPGCMDGSGLETWSNLTNLEILDLSYNYLHRSIHDLTSVRSLRTLIMKANNIEDSQPIKGPESLSNLTNLEILDLSDNCLDRSIIYDLASVPSLRTLKLFSIYIDGGLPINGFESWSNLTKLEMLDLSANNLPTSFISSLAKLSSLRTLYLDYSSMEGNVPVKELSALNLEVVSLRACFFSGSVPYLGHWSSLKALSLAENDPSGTLTSTGLCRLKNLQELDLSRNNLTGNLPSCVGNLSSLKLVDLSYNQFQIKFPSIFESLVYLWYLSLSKNQLEGTLSIRSFLNHFNLEVLSLSTWASNFRVEVVNLPFQLQELELANCNLDAEPTFLHSQHNLRYLDLSNTHSKGLVPAVWLLENNTNLIKLDLHKNFFTGPLQLPFITHEKLQILDISVNHLGGELPTNITTKLPNLCCLNLSNNYVQGPFPLISTGNLYFLDLSFNNLTDDINNNFSRIQPYSHLLFIDISNNKFYGSFTNSLIFSEELGTLLLNDNDISGEIPLSICNASFIFLDISNNELNGVLPDCIGRANLGVLNLAGNYLEGSLPLEVCAMRGLQLLNLSDNNFSGSIPPCSNQSELSIVDLSLNHLTGKFPITWLNISYINVIDIRENHLSGELPSWIGNDSNLIMLQARENLIGGPIAEQICQLKNLRILDMSHNNLSGQIPSCIIDMGSEDHNFSSVSIGNFSNDFGDRELNFNDANVFLHVNLADGIPVYTGKLFNIGLELMSKGRLDFYWEKNLLMECIIDLSSNKLVGNIPQNIGQMKWLITLNFSNNHLSGAIPNSISNLHQLESLDLSHNSFIGQIPRELIKLIFLESFSVAYNDLSGPTLGVENQFSTFDNSSYEGNPNLCGPPLSKSCFPTLDTQPSPNERRDNRRYEGVDFLILFGSFSLCFVVSFWGFMAVLYFKRNWRYALFSLVDWYGDVIYVKVVLLARKIGVARTRRCN